MQAERWNVADCGTNQFSSKKGNHAHLPIHKLIREQVAVRIMQRVDSIEPFLRSDKPRTFAKRRAPRRRALPATGGAFDYVGGTTASSPPVAANGSCLACVLDASPHASSPSSETAPPIGYRRFHIPHHFTSVPEAHVSDGPAPRKPSLTSAPNASFGHVQKSVRSCQVALHR